MKVRELPVRTARRLVIMALEICGRCSGTGVVQGRICATCGGTGARRP